MWAEPLGWSQPYFEIRVTCYRCSHNSGGYIAAFGPSAKHLCRKCKAAFSQEEGILQGLLHSLRLCSRRVEGGDETESRLLEFVDEEVFLGGRFGFNVSYNHTGYSKKDEPSFIGLPATFRHPPRVFAHIFPEGSDNRSSSVMMPAPTTLEYVQVATYGSTPSGGEVPFSLQLHGHAEEGVAELPPYFIFLDDALRSVVRRDYALAVFLGATATEAFVSALLTNRLSNGSNDQAIFELVSHAGAAHKARDVLPMALGARPPKDLTKGYERTVGKVRNEFAHGKLPSVTLPGTLESLQTCVLCIAWALRKAAENGQTARR